MDESYNMKILIIDDDADIGNIICDCAVAQGHTCIATTKPTEFINAITPDTCLLILDLMMPDMDGIEVLRILAQQKCKSKILIISGIEKRVLENAGTLAASLGLSVMGTIHKPFRLVELETMLMHCAETLESELQIFRQTGSDVKPEFKPSKEELLYAINEKQFVVYYQPQVYIKNNHVRGFEALVRWQHPEHGLIPPVQFINMMELYSIIDQLTWLVIEQSMHGLRKFSAANFHVNLLAINISPYSLYDLRFPDKLVQIAKKYSVDEQNIILEITETGILRDLTTVLDILTRLRIKQFKLSIDDYGTGYATISQLRNIPANELKIDKSFVDGISQESTQPMIKEMIHLAHYLGMQVVAEGVETVEQLDFLRQNNCDIVQGYYFSRPLPFDKILAWLQSRAQK